MSIDINNANFKIFTDFAATAKIVPKSSSASPSPGRNGRQFSFWRGGRCFRAM